MWAMKKSISMMAIVLTISTNISAQTWGEWFRQKATQTKYLVEQIAALKVYAWYLSNGYTIAKEGLGAIQDLKQGDFSLHKNYFNSLVNVNPRVRQYSRVAEIISLELSITKQTASTIRTCQNTKQLTSSELDYLSIVFDAVLADCSACKDAVVNLITDGQVFMKDDERIKSIDKNYQQMMEAGVFVRSFRNTALLLCRQRLQEQQGLQKIQQLNGLK
jgi:hypothetical protein